jgi:hypothetical protein
LRNIDHFAFLRRHTEVPQMEEFHFPIRGAALHHSTAEAFVAGGEL